MSENIDKPKGRSQAELLDERIEAMKAGSPDSPMLIHLITQRNSIRRQERQKAGLERPWPNPCM